MANSNKKEFLGNKKSQKSMSMTWTPLMKYILLLAALSLIMYLAFKVVIMRIKEIYF